MGDFGLILGLAGLLALLLLAGVLYQRRGVARDAQRFPAPGRLIDIGGYRLHLEQKGQGAPTVVFEAGVVATSLSWSLVQPEVARFTSTASYDRAWLGWSDSTDAPRDIRQVVRELDLLLDRAGVDTPIILVAHSYGALVARMYQIRRPARVGGIVLVDPMALREWTPPSVALRALLDRGIRLSYRGLWLAHLGVVRFALNLLAGGGRRLPKLIARAGSGRASAFTDRIVGQIRKLPAESWPLVQAHWSNPKCFEGMARYLEKLPESAAVVAAEAPPVALRGVPSVVLSADSAALHERREHEALAQDAGARLETVESTGHWIQIDRPDAVIAAVRDMVARIRGG
jgi:pimeloyl-ACP methyl ester carboxylesterase